MHLNLLAHTFEYETWTEWKEEGVLSDKWVDFPTFLSEVGTRPAYGYKLRLINPATGAVPGNTQWIQTEEGYSKGFRPNGRKRRLKPHELPLEVLQQAVAEVKNKSHLELRLYGASASGRANELMSRAKAEGISLDHWTGRFTKRTRISIIKRKEDFRNHAPSNVRKRVLSEGLIPYVCSGCNLEPMWQGKTLTLHMDHIDGDKKNHTLENLRFLCPNCHQQTKTWGNKRNRKLPADDTILLKLAETKTRTEIAEMYGVHSSTVSHRLRKYND